MSVIFTFKPLKNDVRLSTLSCVFSGISSRTQPLPHIPYYPIPYYPYYPTNTTEKHLRRRVRLFHNLNEFQTLSRYLKTRVYILKRV